MSQILVRSVMILHCTFFVWFCLAVVYTLTQQPPYQGIGMKWLISWHPPPPLPFCFHIIVVASSSAFYETVRLQYLYIDLMTSNVQPFLCFFVMFLVLLCLLIGATLQLTPLQLEALLTDGNTSRFWLVGSVDISWISYSWTYCKYVFS